MNEQERQKLADAALLRLRKIGKDMTAKLREHIEHGFPENTPTPTVYERMDDAKIAAEIESFNKFERSLYQRAGRGEYCGDFVNEAKELLNAILAEMKRR